MRFKMAHVLHTNRSMEEDDSGRRANRRRYLSSNNESRHERKKAAGKPAHCLTSQIGGARIKNSFGKGRMPG